MPGTGRGNGRRRRALALLAAIVSMAALLVGLKSLGLSLNLSASMPVGVYRQVSVPRPPERGEMVEICAPPAVARLGAERGYLRQGSCPFKTSPLLKFVGAIRGDVVDVEAGAVRINGILLPGSAATSRDGEGRPIPRIRAGRYVLGDGEIWVWSPFPRGWDSRYYGALPVSGLVAIVRPVCIFGSDTSEQVRTRAADRTTKALAAGRALR